MLSAIALVLALIPQIGVVENGNASETRALNESEVAAVTAAAERWGDAQLHYGHLSDSSGAGSAVLVLEPASIGSSCLAQVLRFEGRRQQDGEWIWRDAVATPSYFYWHNVSDCEGVREIPAIHLSTIMDSMTLTSIIESAPRLFEEARDVLDDDSEEAFTSISGISLRPVDDGMHYTVVFAVDGCASILAELRLDGGRPSVHEAYWIEC